MLERDNERDKRRDEEQLRINLLPITFQHQFQYYGKAVPDKHDDTKMNKNCESSKTLVLLKKCTSKH